MLPPSIHRFLSEVRSYLLHGVAILLLKIAESGYRVMPGLTGSLLSEGFFSYFFRYFSYYGNLRTDLERYIRTGMLRADWVRQEGEWIQTEKSKNKKRLRVGMLGTFGREANFPKDFFHNAPENVELIVYDLHRPKKNMPYSDCSFLKGESDVLYKKVRDLRHYNEDNNGQIGLADEMNEDDIDVLVLSLGEFVLKLLDKLKIPVIIPMNVTSLPVPHPKCGIQMYVQPPWPYQIRDDKLYNLKKGKYLEFPIIEKEGIIYSRRATKEFQIVDWHKRETQIYFSGNLKKLISGTFSRVLMNLMTGHPDLKLRYFGRSDTKYLQEVRSNFQQNGILDRTEYGGEFTQNVDEEGNFIIDDKLRRVFTELGRSKLMLNTFPISGARSCIEAYALEVPVIHLSSEGKTWLKAQKNVPFRLPIIHTDSGTAHTIQEYQGKADRVLSDAFFAGTIIEEQNEILEKLTDTKRFWNMIQDITKEDMAATHYKKY